MTTGMLWFDNSNALLSVKIQKAMDYYIKKYGREPNMCLVNPSMMDEKDRKEMVIGNLTVLPYKPVLPGHIWIGVEDGEAKKKK